MSRVKFHPACLLFPQLSQAELEELADDIRQNGLLNPIVTLNGQVLDGRNRLAACVIAGVQPRYQEWDGNGSPVEWVISQNLFRRHLTASQRAVVAFDLLPILEAEAKQRQRISTGRGKKVAKNLATLSGYGKASQTAARIAKTNSTYVEAVKAISRQAPELVEQVRVGTLKVTEASDLAKLPRNQRSKVLRLAEQQKTKGKVARIIRQAELDHRQESVQRADRNGQPAGKQGKIEIWCGDCVLLMQEQLKPKSVSVVVTSVPYNLGVAYRSYDDHRPEEEYLGWLAEVFEAIKRVAVAQFIR